MSQSYASAGIPLDPPWRDWTPTYVNFTLGNGTVVARYKPGNLIVARFNLVFGSTTTIDGTDPRFSMPVLAASDYDFTDVLGVADMHDAGADQYPGVVRAFDTNEFIITASEVTGTYGHHIAISATVPFTWATSDTISFLAIYEAA